MLNLLNMLEIDFLSGLTRESWIKVLQVVVCTFVTTHSPDFCTCTRVQVYMTFLFAPRDMMSEAEQVLNRTASFAIHRVVSFVYLQIFKNFVGDNAEKQINLNARLRVCLSLCVFFGVYSCARV
jgi:hypothetical protein